MSNAATSTRTRIAVAGAVVVVAGFAGGYALANSGGAKSAAAVNVPPRFSPDDARPEIDLPADEAALPALKQEDSSVDRGDTAVTPPPPVSPNPPPPPVSPQPPPPPPPPPPAPNPDPEE